ncbi:ABC transporter permease [Leucobacter sp. CSA2]|uniref:ABC transporter permease n=1 Tax=Leucobacter edaphi TaxID=2796472 RepID=A0A934QBC8_9MICO|nr:ABC transporter permease [Leucobacter edaphi]MBK0421575.1 ABC transporter permease [Leucobacter edaphi]
MNWAIDNVEQLLGIVAQHAVLAVAPTAIGLALAIPLGMILHRTRTARAVAVVASGIVFTVPSLALFVVIPSLIGTRILDPVNVVVALSLYSVALLLRSVLEALDAIDPAVLDAAEAIGTSRTRRALGTELPLAIPVLAAGARVVAVTNVSLVSVGAVIGVGGLGQLFTAGFQRNAPEQIAVGILATLALAFLIDRALGISARALTPWLRVPPVQEAERAG